MLFGVITCVGCVLTMCSLCWNGVNACTCFGRYSPIFRRLCRDAICCNYVRKICVVYMQVAVEKCKKLVLIH
jgi:hypothetical protein